MKKTLIAILLLVAGVISATATKSKKAAFSIYYFPVDWSWNPQPYTGIFPPESPSGLGCDEGFVPCAKGWTNYYHDNVTGYYYASGVAVDGTETYKH